MSELPEAFEFLEARNNTNVKGGGEGGANSCHHWSQAGDPQSLQQLQKAMKTLSLGYTWALGLCYLF